jgi:hypothetical protein
LKLPDVDGHRRVVFIREGKGRRDRYVPIGERALGWIARYRDEVRPLLVAGADGGTLFLNDTGLPYSVSAIGYHVKKHIARAGLKITGACHLFRHACATHMLEGGADVRFVQAMLGHANLSTTEIYTHVAINTLQAVHAATHPAEADTATTGIDDAVSADVELDESDPGGTPGMGRGEIDAPGANAETDPRRRLPKPPISSGMETEHTIGALDTPTSRDKGFKRRTRCPRPTR